MNGKIKGYYTNNVYMGFIPSVGKYWQFESETAYREYLEEKAKTCNDTTLAKHKQHIESLALFASDSYKMKIDWTVDKVYSKNATKLSFANDFPFEKPIVKPLDGDILLVGATRFFRCPYFI